MALDKETASQYTLVATDAQGKEVSINFADIVAAREAEQNAATALVDPKDEAHGAKYGDTPEARAAMDAQLAFAADPTSKDARAKYEAAMHALATLVAKNHVDINRSRDDIYDRELLAKGYTWEQIARSYRKRAEAYRLDLVTYATRARNMENEIRSLLDPLRTSTKLSRECMRQIIQAAIIKDTDPGLAVMMLEEVEDKLNRLNEDQSFRDEVKRFRESLNASKLDAIEMPIVEDARVGNYHGE